MKKAIFVLTLSVSLGVSAQVYQARVLEVDPVNMEKLIKAVAQKTKLYNNKPGAARFATFQILTGPQANNIYRVQVAETIGDLDRSISSEELDYWWKTTGKLHTPLANRIYIDNEAASLTPENAEPMNHRRVLFYKLIPGKEKHFWRYRTRLVKALAAANWPNRVQVMNCQSGCNGSWVQVRYYHKNFAGEAEDNSQFGKVVEAYDELYGENAYEDDSANLSASVSENITHHQRMLPEASSKWE